MEGSKATLDYVDYLEHFKEWWDTFQSDACYCGEDRSFDEETK